MASQISYRPISLNELVERAPLVVEALHLSASQNGSRYEVVNTLWKKASANEIGSKKKILVHPAGAWEWSQVESIHKATGTRRSPLVYAYRGDDRVDSPVPGSRYLLFLTDAREESTFDLFAEGAVLAADKKASLLRLRDKK
jgi:hypothetical protein